MIKGNIILLNKESGISSHTKINRYKKENNIKKIGHIGTLDPMAQGLLIALTEDATKLSDYLMKKDKVYEVEMSLGYETDTLDSEGKIVLEKEYTIDLEKITETINSFVGKIEQVPPKYSAIKIDGKKLYNLARNNIDIQIPKRNVEIYYIKDIKVIDNKICFVCKVSSGTYIRSLCRDIAYKLDTCATMTYLKRLSIGQFNLSDANNIINPKDILDYPRVEVNDITFKKLLNGMTIVLTNNVNCEKLNVYYNNEYIGVVDVFDNKKIKRSNFFVTREGIEL